ncbi:MAG TPA: LysM domain-containing protein [Mobilitalea sp.]|nr:LysM domain-containing protein [Mobilitalea sp.]
MSGAIQYTIRPYDTIWMLAQVFNTTVDSIMEVNPGINPRNLQNGQVITIRPGFQYYQSYSGDDMELDDNMENDTMMCELMNYFRMLWEQHVAWTRMAIMGIVHELPETEMILQRLLRNPADFANALRTFYGDEVAQSFAELFTAHLTIAAELVNAAKAGDTNAVANAEQRWFDNARQIAEFLGSINPNWSTEDWNVMMNEHLELLRDNTLEMIDQNYEASIIGSDDIEAQALEMADMMAEGIAMQFPMDIPMDM